MNIHDVTLLIVSIIFAVNLVRLLGVWFFKRLRKIAKEEMETVAFLADSLKQAELIGSIKQRFKEFDRLTKDQQNLFKSADAPSRSASHSKFKNSVFSEIKQIEEKKRDILKSILEDGFDAPVQMVDGDGTMTRMRISEVLAKDSKTDPIPSQKPERKLRLVKGEKDDQSSGKPLH